MSNNHPNCPKCRNNNDVVRNGEVTRRRKKEVTGIYQRYLCKVCGLTFLPDTRIPKEDKHRQALIMYLEGMNFSQIGKLLGVEHDAVKEWFIKYNIDLNTIEALRNTRTKGIGEIDEIHIYGYHNIINDFNDSDHNTSKDSKATYSQNKIFKHSRYNIGFVILEKDEKIHISYLEK